MSNNPVTAKRRAQNRNAQRNHRNNVKNRIASLEETNRSLIAIILQNRLPSQQLNPQDTPQVWDEVRNLFTNESSLVESPMEAGIEQDALQIEELGSNLDGSNTISTLPENEFSALSSTSRSSWPVSEPQECSHGFASLLEDWGANSPIDGSASPWIVHVGQRAGHTVALQDIVPAASQSTGSEQSAGNPDGDQLIHLPEQRFDDIEGQQGLLSGSGQRTLALAIQHSHKEVVQFLIARGADPNAPDGNGRTPLHMCAENGDASIVGVLIENGASIDKQNQQGMTPLQVASSKGALAVVKALVEHGAKID